MTKNNLSIFLVLVISMSTLFSCRKANNSTVDPTLNYFPLTTGKYVTYDVDSVYYSGPPACTQLEVKSQLKYMITDTFSDDLGRESYIMDIFYRPYDGAVWKQSSVIFITPAPTPLLTLTSAKTTSLLYTQDGTQYVKMIFPVVNGFSWAGNQYANITDSLYSYLANWNYTYQDYHLSFNTDFINFDNTVTVMEDDESVNYPDVDSLVNAYRTYAKEVYAYNVGMVYKEWYHTTYKPWNSECLNGYRVVMRAIDHN